MFRKKPAYICSGFANYGKEFCSSFFIEEEEIINVIIRHLEIHKKKIEKPVEEYVKQIEVIEEGYRIIYKDGTKSLMNVPNEHGMLCIRY